MWVHWKWSGRITRLLVQCLESAEYMEIRNALLVLTKISSVFPVTRKTGINIEKRVIKIKGDEREDLKVLATGVAAALASRKQNSWVTEEEFGMGVVDLKPAPSPSAKSLTATAPNGSALNSSQIDPPGVRNVPSTTHTLDSGIRVKDQNQKSKYVDGKPERGESTTHTIKLKSGPLSNGLDAQSLMHTEAGQTGISRPTEVQKHTDESTKGTLDDNMAKVASKIAESESRPPIRRTMPAGSLTKQPTPEASRDDNKPGKAVNGSAMPASSKGSTASVKKSLEMHGTQTKIESGALKPPELRMSMGKVIDDAVISERPFHRSTHSPLRDDLVTASKSSDKQQKRTSPVVEHVKPSKRRKGDNETKDWEGESQLSDRERSLEKSGLEEQSLRRAAEKAFERSKERGNERYERDQRERLERPDKSAGEDTLGEKSRARSMERYAREHSVDRVQDRVIDKTKDERIKDDRSKSRYNDTSIENSHLDDRFHRQSLPPPPPLPPNMVPQSVTASRKDEDVDRRVSSTRQLQRLSPRHEEKERRRSEENSIVSQDDAKRRREDDLRERKRDERDGLSMKVEEREKGSLLKDDMDVSTASKRRKIKRDHLSSGEVSEYPVAISPPHSHALGVSQIYDGRERGERKGNMVQRVGYLEDPGVRMHSKEAVSKIIRRDSDPAYEREWTDEKKLRPDPKRKHRK
ncbi:hypothetical protein GIB67_005171 [Kingdonia uniflora]|uniref:THO complex subunitTHOC2 C-terminal domain-containing protein n=1 Tax=Kingdonia uniflora TaxID=39325 RepID=A0A7J7NMY8_9MAGN|nr:hypothetical protein GIB67_005171 [Kingdonia uniflora]